MRVARRGDVCEVGRARGERQHEPALRRQGRAARAPQLVDRDRDGCHPSCEPGEGARGLQIRLLSRRDERPVDVGGDVLDRAVQRNERTPGGRRGRGGRSRSHGEQPRTHEHHQLTPSHRQVPSPRDSCTEHTGAIVPACPLVPASVAVRSITATPPVRATCSTRRSSRPS